jgi:hypothetical protein
MSYPRIRAAALPKHNQTWAAVNLAVPRDGWAEIWRRNTTSSCPSRGRSALDWDERRERDRALEQALAACEAVDQCRLAERFVYLATLPGKTGFGAPRALSMNGMIGELSTATGVSPRARPVAGGARHPSRVLRGRHPPDPGRERLGRGAIRGGHRGAALSLRVCLVAPYDLADEGGGKRHAEHLSESLRRKGDEVTVVGPLRRGEAGDHARGFGGVVNIPANGAANYMALLTLVSVRRFFLTGTSTWSTC